MPCFELTTLVLATVHQDTTDVEQIAGEVGGSATGSRPRARLAEVEGERAAGDAASTAARSLRGDFSHWDAVHEGMRREEIYEEIYRMRNPPRPRGSAGAPGAIAVRGKVRERWIRCEAAVGRAYGPRATWYPRPGGSSFQATTRRSDPRDGDRGVKIRLSLESAGTETRAGARCPGPRRSAYRDVPGEPWPPARARTRPRLCGRLRPRYGYRARGPPVLARAEAWTSSPRRRRGPNIWHSYSSGSRWLVRLPECAGARVRGATSDPRGWCRSDATGAGRPPPTRPLRRLTRPGSDGFTGRDGGAPGPPRGKRVDAGTSGYAPRPVGHHSAGTSPVTESRSARDRCLSPRLWGVSTYHVRYSSLPKRESAVSAMRSRCIWR